MGKTIARGVFYALALGVWVWMMANTLGIARMVFPPGGDGFLGDMLPYMALVMFDVGAVAWLLVFLRHAEGIVQRSIAVIVSFVSLLGAIFLSVAHLYLGGQALTSIPAEMGTWVLWAIGGMTLVHGIAIWASHIADPEEMRRIKTQSIMDNGKALALDRAEAIVDRELDGIAESMADVYAAGIRTNLLRHAGVSMSHAGVSMSPAMIEAPAPAPAVEFDAASPLVDAVVVETRAKAKK